MRERRRCLRTHSRCRLGDAQRPAIDRGAHAASVAGGDDANPGTAELPWATLEHAAAQVDRGIQSFEAGEYSGMFARRRSDAEAPLTIGPQHAGRQSSPAPVGSGDQPRICRTCGRSLGAQGALALALWVDRCRRSPLRTCGCRTPTPTRAALNQQQRPAFARLQPRGNFRADGPDRGLRARADRAAPRRGGRDPSLWPDRTNRQFVLRGTSSTHDGVLVDSVDRILFEDNVITRMFDGGRCAGASFQFSPATASSATTASTTTGASTSGGSPPTATPSTSAA